MAFSSDGASLVNSNPQDAIYGVTKGVSITPSDTDKIQLTRGIYVGVSGNLAVLNDDDTTVIYKNVAGGYQFGVHTTQVLSTGTTATELIALY
jgi:hypothetical protein